jgi:two-component system, response regulator
VEDNRDDELLTLDALKATGAECEIVVARDGVEALEFLFGNGAHARRDAHDLPAFVLLDVKLPKLSGFEVLQRIRNDKRTQLLPVVLLTSSSQEEDMVRGYSVGANSFVRKPVQFESFMDAVGSLGQYWLTVNEMPPQVGKHADAAESADRRKLGE